MLRYIVERISDGKFLDLELPITVSAAGRKLMGAGGFSGEVLPVSRAYAQVGSQLLVEPFNSFIHEEADGVIRGTWLVTRSEFQGFSWQVEGAGFSAYFSGRPYEGEYRGVEEDPITIARHVISHAQAQTNAGIGVTVAGSSSVRVGTNSDQLVDLRQTDVNTVKAGLDDAKNTLTARKATAKASPTIANKNAVTAAQNVVNTMTAQKKSADEALKAAKDKLSKDGGAWKLYWWDTPDCLESFTEAVEAAGFEWVEWSGWNADKSKVLKELRCVPRVGSRKGSLRFVEGVNVVETVTVQADSSDYANTVVAIGAGEGRKALRFQVGVSDGRRRKVHVLDAKHVTKQAALEVLARSELALRSQLLRVAAVRVDASHPNAERGTFDVGDVIQVDVAEGVLDRKSLWHRIEEVEWDGLDVADLILVEA